MRVIVVTQTVPSDINALIKLDSKDYIIAVDGAIDALISQNIEVDLVIGDMDSVENTQKIEQLNKIVLNANKDETDTLIALNKAYSISDNVYLIGGIKGKRIEHFIANLTMFDVFPNLTIIDEDTKIWTLSKGSYNFDFDSKYYISFFNYDVANITLVGYKYPLDNYELKRYDALCISNEIIAKDNQLIINKGTVLIVVAKK